MINLSHFDKFPNLTSERLLFRKFELSDAKEIFAIRNDEKVMHYMDSLPHESITISEKFIAENLKSYKQKKGIFWAIIDKSNGAFIGDFAYWRIDSQHHRGEIGYTLASDYWSKGYMSETMRVLIPFGFEQLGLHSIEANINPDNINSRKVLLKIGFKKEALFKENFYYNGSYLDSEIYSLLESWYV